MTCPKCGGFWPAWALDCPDCVAERSRQALLEYQRLVLPAVAAGHSDLRLAKVAGGVVHLELFRDPHRSYCGVELKAPHRERCRLAKLDRSTICAQCAAVLEYLLVPPADLPVEEVPAESEDAYCRCVRTGDEEDTRGCPVHDTRPVRVDV